MSNTAGVSSQPIVIPSVIDINKARNPLTISFEILLLLVFYTRHCLAEKDLSMPLNGEQNNIQSLLVQVKTLLTPEYFFMIYGPISSFEQNVKKKNEKMNILAHSRDSLFSIKSDMKNGRTMGGLSFQTKEV